MSDHIRITQAVTVPLSELSPHPANARRGDVDKIAESLAHHGQYRPIVVNKRDNTILAGNHTFKAARKLKWKKIAVVYVDVDEHAARKILLVDNRASDLAMYDEPALKAMLEELPSYEGTGFTAEDVANLDELLNAPFSPDTKPMRSPDDDEHRIVLGPITATIDPDVYQAWEEMLLQEFENSKPRAIKGLKAKLQLPQPEPPIKRDPSTLLSPPEKVKADAVPLEDLRPYPGNPRQGDVGAIVESLETLGQYRPIVARTDGTILAGNHTYQAAKFLGWSHIAVTWVQCTDEEAARIVLVDNRTADHATYDPTALKDLIASLPDWKGTGYQPSEAAEILTGGATRPGPDTTGKTTCRIGDFSFRMSRVDVHKWAAGLTIEDIATRLELPIESLTQ